MEEYTVRLLWACIFLWMTAVPDLRAQRIPLWIPGFFFTGATAVNLLCPSCFERWELWAGAVPGVLLLLLSCLLRGKMGEGDGICLAVCGLITGILPAIMIAETAIVLASAAGVFCMWTGRWKAGDRIAFMPFLAAAGSLLLLKGMMRAI